MASRSCISCFRFPVSCLLFFSWHGTAHAIEKHPDLLPGEDGCERWLGGSSGNDPSVRLNLVLCREGTRARGRVQWSSLLSGWNVREVAGTFGGDGVVLRDLRIIEERPEPGWRFCVVDRWTLRVDGPAKRMEGTYDSEACDDHATVWFEKMVEADAGPAATPSPNPGPTPNPSPNPSPAPEPTPEPEPKPDRCRCGGGGASGWGALAVLLVLATRPSGGARSAGRSRRAPPRRWRRSRS